MPRRLLIVGIISLSALMLRAEAFPSVGVDSVSSEFFREWYITTDLGHYLDNMNDYVVVESETTGEWNLGGQTVFSVAGNSFRQNRYRWNGMRVDSRAQTGSMLLHVNLAHTSLALNYHTGVLSFADDSVQQQQLRLTGNIGNIGGISPGTRQLINLFHSSGEERTMDSRPVTMRNHVIGAGTAEVTYAIPLDDGQVYQHLYVHYGRRTQTAFDHTGITALVPADYYIAQADGQLAIRANKGFDKAYYFLSASGTTDGYSEFLYGRNEQASIGDVKWGVTMSKTFAHNDRLQYGLSLAVTDIRRDSLSFCRNIFDQDGEAFEPYYAPGKTTEVNLCVDYIRPLLPWLRLELATYNSLVARSVTSSSFQTHAYAQLISDLLPQQLYTYHWQAKPFVAGLLENEVQVVAAKQLTKTLYGEAAVGVTLDGMLQGDGRSIVSPNITAHAALTYQPARWFTIGLTLSHERMAYTMNELLYLNASHLNADIRYADGALYKQTGGAYHQPAKDLWRKQPSYAVLDLPIRFTFGKKTHHEISLLNSARKYYNQWFTVAAEDGGYLVTTQPLDLMSGTIGGRTPYYLSNTVKYTMQSEHWFVALSWQSYLMAGFSTLGNGPLHNNIGCLSETTADANTFVAVREGSKPYQGNSRLNQDKSFIARLQVTYNPIKYFSASLNFKFKDGQPFSTYVTSRATDGEGHPVVTITHADAKGINMANGEFGKREDAFFNLDLRLTGRWWGKLTRHEIEMLWYNLYDFGTALTEYTFDDAVHPTYPYWTNTRGISTMKDSRTSMSLCIPRGVLFTYRIGW